MTNAATHLALLVAERVTILCHRFRREIKGTLQRIKPFLLFLLCNWRWHYDDIITKKSF